MSALLANLSSQTRRSPDKGRHWHQFKAMTTPCTVDGFFKSPSDAQRCFKEIELNTLRLERKYNFYAPSSLLSKWNQRKSSKVRLDKESKAVLEQVARLSAATKGGFDISLGTLKQAVKGQDAQRVQQQMAQLKAYVGPTVWQVQGDYLHFEFAQTQLDLGGVIKEVAVDQAVAILKKYTAAGIVNFGGDLYCLGAKPDGQNFKIGIKHPHNPQQQIAVVALCNQALTTSAHYERSITVGNTLFSHVLGMLNADILSATIIADSVLEAGVYSTALLTASNFALANSVKVLLIDKNLNVKHNILL